jgi:chaperonin cofactor prefoldin
MQSDISILKDGMENLSKKVDVLEQKVDSLEQKVDILRQDVDGLEDNYAGMRLIVAKIEIEHGKKLDVLCEADDVRISKQHILDKRVSRLEETTENHTLEINVLKTKIPS